jgi:hypothetical protein
LGISVTPSTPRSVETPSLTPRGTSNKSNQPQKIVEKPKVPINPFVQPPQPKPQEQRPQEVKRDVYPQPKKPSIDVNRAEAKMKQLEREKVRMAEVLSKLQKEREDKRLQHEERMRKLAKENQQRMEEIKRMQIEKQQRANQQRQEQVKKPITNPLLVNNTPQKVAPKKQSSPLSIEPTPQNSKLVNNKPSPIIKGDYKMAQQQMQDKKEKEAKLERIKKEKEEWIEKVKDLKKKVADLELQKQQNDVVTPEMSAKDKVLWAKEQKRIAEQQQKEQELLKARQNYYNERVNVQQLQKQEPSAPSKQQPHQDKQRVPYNPNPTPSNVGHVSPEEDPDDDSESDTNSDDELIDKYQALIQQNTRKIDHLKKSICMAKVGESVVPDSSDSELSDDDDDYDDGDYMNDDNDTTDRNDEEEEEEILDDDEHVHVGGRLSDRIQFLKSKCESIFGLELFDKIYESSKNAEMQRNMETEQQKEKRLERVLGSRYLSKLEYCHLIDELLFVESNLEPL